MDGLSPLIIMFGENDTRIPVSFSLLDDDLEEGFENFTLQLGLDGADETVRIMGESAMIHIKDDDGQ